MLNIKKYDNVIEIVISGTGALKRSSFKNNEIIDFQVDFSCGDLEEADNYIIKLPKRIFNKDITCDLKDAILKLYNYIDNNYKVRIWSSHYDVDCYLLLLFICNLLNNKVDNLIVLYSDEYKKECYSPGTMTSNELEELSNYEHILTKKEINSLSEEWNSIKKENSDIRIIKNKKIESVDYDYFDNEIINLLKERKEIRIIDIVYELTTKYYINDIIFIYIINKLINSNKIKITFKDNTYIKSAIEMVE